tara:strand:+ start:3714 stop:3923 length:210 start_codon:yes stop_codon:yes gene_type:complete
MSILNKLQQQGSGLSGLNGGTPDIPNFAESTLHDTYSVNGNPNKVGKPSPSTLDLNGETPSKYVDNMPE